MSCCNNRPCFGVINSGCTSTTSSVVRPTPVPEAFYATLNNSGAIDMTAKIILTTAPVIGDAFSFTAPGTTVSINKTGLYQINYSTTAMGTEEGTVGVGLMIQDAIVNSTIQQESADETTLVEIGGTYMLNVTTVPTTVAMYNASANSAKYINPQLSIVKIS